MAILKKANSALKRLKRDESGTAALSWALSLTAIIGAMGAAMDFAMLSSADARSQTIADTTALAAAIYVKNFEQIPQDRAKGLIGEYTANELGYDYRNWVIDGAEGVSVNVSYDNVKREATATVTGYTQPTLMQILGFEELKFKAETVVKYYEKDLQDPASIVMVLDNSGSMHFDDIPVDPVTKASPSTGVKRMDGLKTAAKSFMDIMETSVGPQPTDGSVDLVLRTGMMAFDSGIVRTVPMNWGYIADGEFDAMVPLAATNSAPPLTAANTWLNVTEPPIHEANLPGKTPLKYLILMTDGKNTVGTEEWVARPNTEQWRRWVTGRPSRGDLGEAVSETTTTPPVCTVEMVSVWFRQCDWTDGYESRRKESSFRQPNSGYSDYWEASWSCYSEEEQEPDEVCTEGTTTVTWSGWEYYQGETPYDNDTGWEEGEFDIESNIQTRAECDSLHAAGVEVFSVGFALVPGQFDVNSWPGRAAYGNHYPPDVDPYTGETYTTDTGIDNANKAKAILQYCASRPENFITANDTASLQTAFDRIGNTIIKEIIRISS